MKKKLYLGDCLEILKTIPENKIDTCITDPPYELGFMNKDWDSAGISFQKETWEAVYRVLKPGALLLAFGGTRTWHRIAVAIEDAGFEIRDTICWLYGQGFPKSYNIGKGIDKKAGKEREVIGKYTHPGLLDGTRSGRIWDTALERPIDNNVYGKDERTLGDRHNITAPATPEAELWEGYGTALKPAVEFIIVAMKPIDGTFVNNALIHGVAGMWIDGGRIPTNEIKEMDSEFNAGFWKSSGGKGKRWTGDGTNNPNGRWPANVILDETSAELLDQQTGIQKGGFVRNRTDGARPFENDGKDTGYETVAEISEPDGGSSRFFKVVKNDFSMYNIEIGGESCGNTLENQKVVGILNGVMKEVERYIQNVEQFLIGKKKTENFQKDMKFIISTLIKQMIELKIYNAYLEENIDYYMEESEKIIRSLMELNTENAKDVENIKNLIVFKNELIALIKDIVNNANESIFKNGEQIIESIGINITENTEKENLINRFFYCAKASKKERNAGLDDLPDKQKYAKDGSSNSHEIFTSESANDEAWAKKNPNLPTKNTHATVKPLALMEYLCKLTRTPTGGIVLDPFMGSGTTGMACVNTDRDFIGIELVEEHYIIARKRIEYTQQLLKEN